MKRSRGSVFTTLSFGTLMVAGVFLAALIHLRKDFSWHEATLPPGVQEFSGSIVQQGDYKLSGPYTHDPNASHD